VRDYFKKKKILDAAKRKQSEDFFELLDKCTNIKIDSGKYELTVSKGNVSKSWTVDAVKKVARARLIRFISYINHSDNNPASRNINFLDCSLYYDYYGFIKNNGQIFTDIEENSKDSTLAVLDDCRSIFWVSRQSGELSMVIAVRSDNNWLTTFIRSPLSVEFHELQDIYMKIIVNR